MIENLQVGQIIWYNNISFSSISGAPKRKDMKQPTCCSISSIRVYNYGTELALSPINPDQGNKIRAYYSSTYPDYCDNFHKNRKESAESYNKKIDKKIDWYRNLLEDGTLYSYLQQPAFPDSSIFSEESCPISLGTVLSEIEARGSGPRRDVGYIFVSSKKYGIDVPWYFWEVDNHDITRDGNRICFSHYYKTVSVSTIDYGKSPYSTLYKTTNDLFSGYIKNLENLQEDLTRQVEEKIKKLEKLKVLI